jgi:hypothetical protein
MSMPEGQGPPPPTGYPGTVAPEPGPSYPPSGPPSYAPSAPPPAKTSGRRTGLVILATLAVIIILVVGALWLFRDRISGDVNGLQVGDCIDQPSSSTAITDIQHQPCTEPHDGEVFALITHPAANDAAYPGKDAFRDLVVQECLPQVQVYTGRTLDEIDAAGLTYAWFYPTTSSWTDSDDRGITCYLARDDETKMTGSVRAGGASTNP